MKSDWNGMPFSSGIRSGETPVTQSRDAHHDFHSEANKLFSCSTHRKSSNSLPAVLRANQQCRQPGRLALVTCREAEPDNSDVIFSQRELIKTHKNNSGSALGSDGIYHINSQLGLASKLALPLWPYFRRQKTFLRR